jgi:hypothetical protein
LPRPASDAIAPNDHGTDSASRESRRSWTWARALRLVRDVANDSDAALACAAAAIERVEQEIDHLWFDSMKAEDRATSQRLAEVSHALQRAARLLEPDNTIG